MKKKIAEELLSIGAVFLRPGEPFTWASGIKSPIYCDNRMILSFPKSRDIVEKAIADTIKSEYPECEMLMGTSTAGIAHAAIAADILRLPMGYVRSNAKGHGRTNRIEGRCDEGTKVVVIEDLISTAGSAISTCEALEEHGAEVMGILSIFTYGMNEGKKALKENDIKNISLCDIETLLGKAVEMNYITEQESRAVLLFCKNPKDESWMKGEDGGNQKFN